MRGFVPFLLAVALGSCDRKPRDQPPEHEVTPTGLVLPWSSDHAAAIERLQGIWVARSMGGPRYRAAWKVSGTNITIYDARKKTEVTDIIEFASPCDLAVHGDGGTLVIDGDTIYLGLGFGGTTDGTTTIACLSGRTVYATPAGCKTYALGSGWAVIESTCSTRVNTKGGREFVVDEKTGAFAGEHVIEFASDTILRSPQLTAEPLERQPDWDTAKARADSLYAELEARFH